MRAFDFSIRSSPLSGSAGFINPPGCRRHISERQGDDHVTWGISSALLILCRLGRLISVVTILALLSTADLLRLLHHLGDIPGHKRSRFVDKERHERGWAFSLYIVDRLNFGLDGQLAIQLVVHTVKKHKLGSEFHRHRHLCWADRLGYSAVEEDWPENWQPPISRWIDRYWSA